MESEGSKAGPSGDQTTVVNQTVVVVGSKKSVAVAAILSLFFGPLGMLYSTVSGAIVMFFVGLVLILSVGYPAFFVLIPAYVGWAMVAADKHNHDLETTAQELREQKL